MALMDKMKAQASQLAQKAQEAGKAGQSKIEEVQAKRRADGLLRQLGREIYAQHTGTASNDTPDKIESLIAELKTYEADHGSLDSDDNSATNGTTPDEGDTPPEGGFKL